MDEELGRWWQAVAQLVQEAHVVRGDQLPRMVEQAARRVGIEAELYLVDLGQQVLCPILGGAEAALDVEGTVAGRAFQLSEILPSGDPGTGPVLWVPLLDGTERLGVIRMQLPAGTELPDRALEERCWTLSGLVGHIVMTKFPYSDTLHRSRRSEPLSVASELLWQLLPPRTFASDQLVLTALLEPYDRIGGDAFDYAVDDAVASFAVFDGVGHDVQAGMTTALALAAIRNARRCGEQDLDSMAGRADELITVQGAGSRFVTAALARLDTTTGQLSYLLAGHPPPLLLRGNKTVKILEQPPRVPLGVRTHGHPSRSRTAEEQLEPGDRLLVYTDGITEARDPDGQFFGTDRLIDLTERACASNLPAPETLRRLIRAVLVYQGGQLQDDATLLMVEWSAVGHHQLLPASVSLG
ncbi:MAG: PP2C family protein-serine/threonine phosphatase [Pseudonocardiaceae bacterium]